MAKQLTFHYNDKDYTLEFTRRTVTQTEQTLVSKGIGLSKAEDASLSLQYELFHGAFLARHKGIDRKLVDEMFNKLNLDDWGPALIDIYADVYGGGGDGQGEIQLTKNW